MVSERFEWRLSEETGKLSKAMVELESRLSGDMVRLEGRLDKRITEEISKLDRRLSENHVQTLRWLFALWVPQIAATIGLFLRK